MCLSLRTQIPRYTVHEQPSRTTLSYFIRAIFIHLCIFFMFYPLYPLPPPVDSSIVGAAMTFLIFISVTTNLILDRSRIERELAITRTTC